MQDNYHKEVGLELELGRLVDDAEVKRMKKNPRQVNHQSTNTQYRMNGELTGTGTFLMRERCT